MGGRDDMTRRATSSSSPLSLDYATVRTTTEQLAAPLSAEDQTIQSMPDASPTKWHRAHTTWFFEAFVLGPHAPWYQPFRAEFGFLFNSYYEAVGPRHARPQRGMITRPGIDEIADYRAHVDAAMCRLLDPVPGPEVTTLVELGLHHEQQHQELLLMDIKHALSRHPFPTGYGAAPWVTPAALGAGGQWHGFDGGIVEIGHTGNGFAFDNEGPRHTALVHPFEIADRLVTCGEWLDFVDDGGYSRPELWMSAGWAEVQASEWSAPEYWYRTDGEWQAFTLAGLRAVDRAAPVEHVSWFEADAFARWAGARLPLEAEWEIAASVAGERGLPADFHGYVWQWTASPYSPYRGFRPASGAVGEYNGKFMVNQYVLRGSAHATPPGHARDTYRNFFPAHSRWMFGGVRLARDVAG
jgi:ergothioneine biosynthesis protein EgtB